jgi:hypothetical protein
MEGPGSLVIAGASFRAGALAETARLSTRPFRREDDGAELMGAEDAGHYASERLGWRCAEERPASFGRARIRDVHRA